MEKKSHQFERCYSTSIKKTNISMTISINVANFYRKAPFKIYLIRKISMPWVVTNLWWKCYHFALSLILQKICCRHRRRSHEAWVGSGKGLGRLELVQIKSCLGSIYCRNFLNHAIIPHIHKEKLELLDLNRICSEFTSTN